MPHLVLLELGLLLLAQNRLAHETVAKRNCRHGIYPSCMSNFETHAVDVQIERHYARDALAGRSYEQQSSLSLTQLTSQQSFTPSFSFAYTGQ